MTVYYCAVKRTQDPIGRQPGEGKRAKRSKETKKGVLTNRAKKKTDGIKSTPQRTDTTHIPVMGWVTCFALRVVEPPRAGRPVQRVFPDDAVSSAAPWLRSRHAPIWKGEKRAMRPHARAYKKKEGEGCQLGYLGSLAGLSHPRDPDIGHGLGVDGCLAATL